MRNLIEKYILAPEELNSYVLDNYIDIINEEGFDKVEVSDFLDFKIHDINQFKRFIDTIFFSDGIFILNRKPVKTKVVNLMIQNGYIKPYMGIGRFGVVEGGPDTYELTYEGLKFVTLFFKTDLNKYLHLYEKGKILVHNKEKLEKDNKNNLFILNLINTVYKLKNNMEEFYNFIEKSNIHIQDVKE